jgi:hypothetical protein
MKLKIVTTIFCMMLITTTISVAKTDMQNNQATLADVLTFGQINFLFNDQEQKDSSWGHLSINVPELLAMYQTDRGFLNVYTHAGWMIQNQLIDNVENMKHLSIYFNLGVKPGEDIQQLSAYVQLADEPTVEFKDGPHDEYDVIPVDYNAEGLGPKSPAIPDYIGLFQFDPAGSTYDYTKPNLHENENVQCAYNQCGPMGVANSLQYLENTHTFFSVPHDHVIGLYGDDSLVGQLDTYMGRATSSRPSGPGVMADEMIEGKFQYLADNGLRYALTHRHQGHGFFDMPTSDFTHAGITSYDDSVDGKVTFDWIEEQLRNCADVEVGIKWGSGGGHVVRIFGCGKTLGQPYLRFKHDSIQTKYDPSDTQGLEEAQVFVSDLDGDGIMNWGSAGNELVLAISETFQPFRLIIKYSPVNFFVSATIVNYADYDLPEVSWSIEAEGFVPFGPLTSGTVKVPAGEEAEIQSGIMLGFGQAKITVMVSIRAHDLIQKAECFLFGPVILGMKEVL